MLIDPDSRKVAMEVGNLSVVCNNKPAELISPENGWRFYVYLIPCHFMQKKNQVGVERREDFIDKMVISWAVGWNESSVQILV